MPELPEVESIARALRQGERGGVILGRKIEAAHLLWERTLAAPAPAVWAGRIAGQVIAGIGRRGKFLVFELSQDYLLIHLRMTGDLRVEPARTPEGAPAPFQPHDRLALDFDNGLRLTFNDARKFGRVWLVADPAGVVGGLGPEPLDLTPDAFYAALQKRGKRQIKPLLLDQTFLAGVGNIYADEALFAAGIHPLALAGRLSREQAETLRCAIRAVLEEGIRRNGASFDWVYRGGRFEFRVYQRTGQPCLNCGTPIERRIIGQRSTHFCPACQPE